MNSPRYERVRQALEQLSQGPVSLQALADAAGQSLFHFQRSFVELAGVTPKEFSQALALQRAKQSLAQADSVMEAALSAGLSGPSRLHDLFVGQEGLSPGEFKNGAAGLTLRWSSADSLLGPIWLAASERGVVSLVFSQGTSDEHMLAKATAQWPLAQWQEARQELAPILDEVLRRISGLGPSRPIGLALSGTSLRLKVWQALMRIPEGQVLSYGQLARQVGAPRAVRAVASCVAANPIAYLIPCHRVIRANADFGEYRWGPRTKRALLGLELARGEASACSTGAI
ncbi:bifunctional transcriptional activator/DNA repair enzyme AdaA [Paucibacter sp. DJ2R-2]|uniref:bifunctional transcriptional activator/DNA repair enzyme AdaA n=1 Tax=Paucibacter sp. DJ2R-2 TaxID=2893558 RepID=UPI0021E47FBF|nr:methylated-DNA--[protein]-cysteine S-methyltransferase [Paucibacter sp. DJ2R-2]MCV2421387.1 methylated-DNA--[protein]-cysteine S-methyltransferase [Paucibacter sp. DJ4R-1]MCV2441158.1 methylated-DNA--[protein]-cysteine S-methyltransferase [Paucibacter sp. DJ2R-2]